MTTEALTAIKAALAKVRPNEWFAQGDRHEVRVSSSYIPEQELIALCATGEGAGTRASYIAACNPSAISAIISSYEGMENELDSFRSSFKEQVAAKARIAELEEALKPFAKWPGDCNKWADEVPVWTVTAHSKEKGSITHGDFRRARAVVSPSGESK